MCDINTAPTSDSTPVPAETDPAEVKLTSPEEQKRASLREYKNAMRFLFTVRRQRVVECGHRYNENEQPGNNCQYCWFAFFNSHADMVKLADEIFMDKGKDILISLRGAKFVKMFGRFMATVETWKAEMKGQDGKDGSGETGIASTNNEGEQVQNAPSVGEAA